MIIYPQTNTTTKPMKVSKLRKLILAQKVKPLTDAELKKLRLNAYKPVR
jgi:hypothetical protein